MGRAFLYILVMLGILGIVVYAGWTVADETVIVPKDGTAYSHELLDPDSGEVIDTLSLRYVGQNVVVSSTDYDASIGDVGVTVPLWVSDDWHCVVKWLTETDSHALVRIELRTGPGMMWRLNPPHQDDEAG